MTNERSNSKTLLPDKHHEVVGKLEIGFNKLNNKFVNLLEEHQKIKQQYKILQEKNQEILFINSDLKEKNQEILRNNSDLKDQNQEILLINLNLRKEKEKILGINSDLKDQNQEILLINLNLEKQNEKILIENSYLNEEKEEVLRKNSSLIEENIKILRINCDLKEKLDEFEKLQQYVLNLESQKNEEIQRLEIISENLEKNLMILEIDENDVNIFKENKSYNINNNFTISNNKGSEKDTKISYSNIKVVVGLDFGIEYSGFSYCHVANSKEICSNDMWPGDTIRLKTNTVLQYDEEFNNVVYWGAPALAKKPKRRQNSKENPPVKLCLGQHDDSMTILPIDYKKAITDFLREIGKVIKERIECCWPTANYFENVLLVIAVPAKKYTPKEMAIMEECVFHANLVKERDSIKLQFITESEAAALYLVKNISPNVGGTIMIVDCDKNIVEITIRTLIGNDRLGEVTARIGEYCGSAFIDKEFMRFLRERFGTCAIDQLKENYNGQLQYMVQKFCQHAKEPFTGGDPEFSYVVDIEDTAPNLIRYVSEETRKIMEDNQWIIDIEYNDIKKMFDPVIDKIIRLIHIQISNIQENRSTVCLIGEFSENKYLQNRIKEEFGHRVNEILVPTLPTATVARGAVTYGLSVIDGLSVI
ncbi:unnamed protein product [Rhizophagus irregularis]|nr:unnamed protein product [Rhizophagus irregularis]